MISLIIALYNEESRFPNRFPQLREFLDHLGEPWELILINDGSKDGTHQLIRRMAEQDSRIRTLHLLRNLGQGAAVKIGMLSSRGDVVLYTDADLAIPFKYFAVLVQRVRQGADIAIASRWMRESVIKEPQPPIRKFLGKVYYGLIHSLYLPQINDTNCGLKAYRGETARRLFGFVRSWRWAFNAEHLWFAHRLGLKIAEVPIEWSHSPQSKVHVMRDGVFTLWELACIPLRRLLRGYPLFH